MITRTRLLHNLEQAIGPKRMNLISEEMFNNLLNETVLVRFSKPYPKIYEIRILKDHAIPYRDYSGRISNYMMYRIPRQFEVPWIDKNETIEWIDIYDYQIGGNDISDAYTGGNFMLNQLFLSARAAMPHTRSYYIITFEEPDLLIIDPPQQVHRDFTVQMKAKRTLRTIPKNMETYFYDYFNLWMKNALYQKYEYEDGSQTFAGVDIDIKVSDYANAMSEIKDMEEEFRKDSLRNPETFQVQTLYMTKARG